MVDTLATPDTRAGAGRPAIAPVVAHTATATTATETQPAGPPPTPTLESEFGTQTFLDNPTFTGPLGDSFDYNPVYFATVQTAQKIASMVGGTVVEQNDMAPYGQFKQAAPNEMIQFADGHKVNAGVIASFFSHGYSQSYIDSLLQQVSEGTNT